MGVDPVLQMVTRDRNRIAIQSDILGAAALGINNILCLSGDHQKFGDKEKEKNVYDMDSSLPQQLKNFEFTRSRMLIGLFRRLENYVLKRSGSIIVICPDLLKQVQKAGQGDKAVLLENVLDFEYTERLPEEIRRQRREYAGDDEKIVLYAGNFQPYQGIPLLLEAAARMKDDPVRFLLVGDTPEAVAGMQKKAEGLGIGGRVSFTGQVPPDSVPGFIQMADALVSPRLSGTNTPLKIYSYLKSGKPVVATCVGALPEYVDQGEPFL